MNMVRRVQYIQGGLGFLDMCDAEDASKEQLLEMAKREGFNLNKYRK